MKTQDLIAALAADARPAPRPSAVALRVLPPVAALVGAGFLALLGPRPGLGGAMADPVVATKILWPACLSLLAFGLAMLLARPEVARPGWRRELAPLIAVAALAPVLALITLATTPPATWARAAFAHNALPCLVSVLGFSLPLTAALIWALRHGATLHPHACGALAGLAASGASAALYALHCPEDSPIFFAGWYGLGMALVTAAGAWAGGRFLRW